MTGEFLIFNFLSSNALAKAEHLTWHKQEDVARFAQGLTERVVIIDDYTEGDCTIGMRKTVDVR